MIVDCRYYAVLKTEAPKEYGEGHITCGISRKCMQLHLNIPMGIYGDNVGNDMCTMYPHIRELQLEVLDFIEPIKA